MQLIREEEVLRKMKRLSHLSKWYDRYEGICGCLEARMITKSQSAYNHAETLYKKVLPDFKRVMEQKNILFCEMVREGVPCLFLTSEINLEVQEAKLNWRPEILIEEGLYREANYGIRTPQGEIIQMPCFIVEEGHENEPPKEYLNIQEVWITDPFSVKMKFGGYFENGYKVDKKPEYY